MDSPIAMGLDLSLTRTGVAFVGDPLQGVETFSFGRDGKRNEPLRVRLERIESTVYSIRACITSTCLDYPRVACVEDMPFGASGGSAADRAGLWWMVVQTLSELDIPVVAVNVSKVKIYATGKGNKHAKDEVMLAIVRRYADAPIKNNDEADATALAMMGARLVGRPYEDSMPQTHLRAMEGLTMP
jgi:Holliday junction resolvasome RuvABC endonuclease subunit